MQDIFFYIFACLTVLCGFLVVANPFSRNPITSAMFLVLTIVSMAGLFVLLHAFFLAAVQILVYAGAVMVLFLFVIMLLDVKAEERRRIKMAGLVGGAASVAAVFAIFIRVLFEDQAGWGATLKPQALEGSTVALGQLLFNYQNKSPQHLLPFEIVSLLLLVAMVGVVLLSKKDLK